MYGVAFKGANLLKMSLLTAAAMLAISLLALVETTNTAEAEDSLPDNGKIAFAIFRPQDESRDIYSVNPDGSSLSPLSKDMKLSGLPMPAWSPDGTEIAFSQPDSRGADISVMNADGSNLRDLDASGTWSSGPTWSPDGTKLAFSSSVAPNYNEDIFVMEPDGSNQINLTKSTEFNESSPDFSPDGSQKCFSGSNSSPPYAPGIYLMDSDGSDTKLLVETDDYGRVERCDWSPDGTKIAFQAAYSLNTKGGHYPKAVKKAVKAGDKMRAANAKYDDAEVYVINAEGSGLTALTSNLTEDIDPRWSPDGTKITFASYRDGDYYVYTMDADGSDVAQVTNSSFWASRPDWQPLTAKSRSLTVHQPDTGGLSLLLVASALLFSGGVMFYAGVKRSM